MKQEQLLEKLQTLVSRLNEDDFDQNTEVGGLIRQVAEKKFFILYKETECIFSFEIAEH